MSGRRRAGDLRRHPAPGAEERSRLPDRSGARVRAAQAQGIARGATMVEAVEGAQERSSSGSTKARRPSCSAASRRGSTRDGPGRRQQAALPPRVRRAQEGAGVRLERSKLADGAVFVLPDRTWWACSGAGRDRARAFVAPEHRPHVEVTAGALVVVRLSGAFLRLFERHRLFGPLTKLTTVTFELEPGNGSAVIALAYSESGRHRVRRDAGRRSPPDSRRKGKDRAWLKDANQVPGGDVVYVRLALPPRLLDDLPNASGSDLGI